MRAVTVLSIPPLIATRTFPFRLITVIKRAGKDKIKLRASSYGLRATGSKLLLSIRYCPDSRRILELRKNAQGSWVIARSILSLLFFNFIDMKKCLIASYLLIVVNSITAQELDYKCRLKAGNRFFLLYRM